ncbi:MAG TPA: anti-virulence regulator CigR family protein [Gammaproteobacteria bacterium]|nr:anti-virulence regulator CigR family protein [Gammaproteobacteria bacterium]
MRKIWYVSTLFAIVSLSALSVTASADRGGNGHGHGKGNPHGFGHGNHGHKSKAYKMKSSKVADKSLPRISNNSRTQIKNFITSNPHVISPTSLPPGIEMNLARGKPLPPGIAKVYLPDDVLSVLPKVPGYEYQVVGHDVVLVNSANGIVSDIISNIIK